MKASERWFGVVRKPPSQSQTTVKFKATAQNRGCECVGRRRNPAGPIPVADLALGPIHHHSRIRPGSNWTTSDVIAACHWIEAQLGNGVAQSGGSR
ncbi:hypothetical protein BDW75DRAFT_220785 [Aspergillus navahoensis]